MRKRKPSRRPAFRRFGGRKQAGRPRELTVRLKVGERKKLKGLIGRGQTSVRVVKRAQVLLAMDRGQRPEEAAEAIGLTASGARQMVRRYRKGGVKGAVEEPSRPGKARAIQPRQEAGLVAMLCGPSPAGRARWTIRLASEEAKKRGVCDAGPETIRVFMKERSLKPWQGKNVAHRGEDA